MKVQVYSAKGVKKAEVDMPKNLVAKENLYLLAQAIRVYEDRSHPGTAKVKTRAEVSLTGAKMYKQKGTGNARHGDYGAPIFAGGGVAHGPKGFKRVLTLPQKMRQNALHVALNYKTQEGKLVLVENINSLQKTKEAQEVIDSVVDKEFEGKLPTKVSIVLSLKNRQSRRVFRNIRNCEVFIFEQLNAYEVFLGGLVLLDKEVLEPKKKDVAKADKEVKKNVVVKEVKSTTKKSAVKKSEKVIKKVQKKG
jgi:large subunit ribosomal protein L4